MPERYTLILTAPTISDRKTFPVADTSKSTDSTTSRKTSFFLYFTPSDLHETALVTVDGGRTSVTSNL